MRHSTQEMTPRRRGSTRGRALLASALAISVVLAACGDGDDDASPTTTAADGADEATADDQPTETTVAETLPEVTLAPAPETTEAAPSTTAAEAEVDMSDVDPNGILRMGTVLVFPAGIHNDPIKSAVNADRVWMSLVYGTLLRRTPTGAIEPWMAESFEIVDDRTMTIVLRDGITFADGTPYDAEAVKAGCCAR